jgi:hypothetical protein
MILAATLDDAPAADDYNGNGLFTSVILSGLASKEAQKDGQVRAHALAQYLLEQVPLVSAKSSAPRRLRWFALSAAISRLVWHVREHFWLGDAR